MTLTQPITDCIEACKATAKSCDETITQCKKTGNMDALLKSSTACKEECEKHSKALATGDHTHLKATVAACEAFAKECDKASKTMPAATQASASAHACIEACRKAEGPVKA